MGFLLVLLIFFVFVVISSSRDNPYPSQSSNNYGSATSPRHRAQRQPRSVLSVEKPDDFEETPEIREILHALESTRQNVFLTGRAGTGKSTLLRYFRATTNKSVAVIAPTGVAAVNVQGQTIHSFFKFGIDIMPNRVRRLPPEQLKVLRGLDTLIIDEISMVRADLFDSIDAALRLNRGVDKPFGDVQIIAIGDLYQLPPVVTDDQRKMFETLYTSPFFFDARSYSLGNFVKRELTKIYRQSDANFIDALNAVREAEPTDAHIALLNSCVVTEPPHEDNYVNLVTTNSIASDINASHMNLLPAKSQFYQGSITGDFKEKNTPTDITLELKVGAQVMLLKNDKHKRWVNGDIVTVIETKADHVVVEFNDHEKSVATIDPYTWESVRFVFDEEQNKVVPVKVGSFTQIPCKPAWALTIHKAQGKTFERVFIDLGSGAFAPGQTYVALSRCKALEGLKLANPILASDIFADKAVKEFMSFTSGT